MINDLKILIVEDESLTARWLQMELSEAGFNVCGFVASGEEAIIVAKREQPNLILMDISLAGKIDGINAAKEIIKIVKVDILFMSAYSEMRIKDRIKDLNPLAFINKPIEIAEIMDIIEKNNI